MSNAMYQAFIEVLPDARNLRRSLAREFDAAGPEAGRAAGRGVKSGVLGSVSKLAGPLAAAFAGLGIGKIIKDSISNASDFVEAGTAISAVFGDADKTVQEFAASATTSAGLSTNAALQAAQTFGIFGKAAGLGGEDLAGFSTEFLTLAGDLASFNNTTPEQAIQALGAGLRGESEPLRQYGVLLDDAALKARATEMGIYSGTGALTQQQKVLAAQAEIMAQTTVQQGDLGRTSEGLANQQRQLSNNMENLSTTFGAIFLPIATTVVGFLNKSVVPAFQGLAGMLSGGEMPAGVAKLTGAFQPLVSFFQTIGSAFAPVLGSLLGPLLELAAALSPAQLIFTALLPVLPQIATLFASLAEPIGALLVGAFTALSGILGFVIPALTSLATFISDNLTLVLGFAVAIGGAVLAFQLYTATMAVVKAVTVAWAAVQVVMNAVLTANPIGLVVIAIGALVAGIIWVATQTTFFQDTWAMLVAVFISSIGMFSDFFKNTGGMFKDFVSNTIGMVGGFVSGVVGFFSGMWSTVGNFFANGVNGIVGFFSGLPGRILGALGNLGGILYSAGRDMINGLLEGAGSLLRNIGSFFLKIVPSWIVEPFKAALGINSPSKVFRGFGVNTGQGYLNGLDDMKGKVSGSLGSFVSLPDVAGSIDASVTGASRSFAGAAGAPIYVENPFTGEYLLARVGSVADGRISTADRNVSRMTKMGLQR
ncbi:hypothetical protein [Cryobacterium sp. CG_9.6]|uniref:phage tail protein n=1 Tax=Cryobacterium sp. CG_9.6 TaxID=2760710 RepID=UPI002476D146|nr:hypothetical protein [Cryobacterium sp. CG_9.6]MDH6237053.1 hypothetical protein [Cryobacterium sp. CG_9.6]